MAALVGERGGEDAALGAGVVEQGAGEAVVERQAVEQLRQRRVQERVGDREEADGEAAVVLGRRVGDRELLAQARAHQSGHQQLVRLAVAAGQHEQHRPAPDRAPAEQRERVADRADPAARSDVGGVGQPQELVREPRVVADHLLEPVEVVLGGLDQLGQRVEPERRRGALGHHSRASEEVALEAVDPELAAVVELLAGLDLLGDDLQVPVAQAAHVLGELLGRQRLDVELADLGQPQQRLVLGAVAEVVEREREADGHELAEHVHQVGVHDLVLDQLEHHPVGGQRQRPEREQELAVDVDERALVADEPLEADVGQRGDEDARGRLGGIQREPLLADGPVQQLEGVDPQVGVEDRLAGEHHIGHGVLGGGGHRSPSDRRVQAAS